MLLPITNGFTVYRATSRALPGARWGSRRRQPSAGLSATRSTHAPLGATRRYCLTRHGG